jgi:glycerophosphoryl diester phosphodiesterase
MDRPLLHALTKHGYAGRNAPVFIQSFEVGNLRRLRRRTQLPMVQLIEEKGAPYDFIAAGAAAVAGDAHGPRHARASSEARGSGGAGVSRGTRVSSDARTYAELITPAGLASIAEYADAIGPSKLLVIPRAASGVLGTPTSLVRDAHAAGLGVHPWTFRAENHFLPTNLRSSEGPTAIGDMGAELSAYLAAGIDGFFTDHPGIARQVLARSSRSDAR